MSSAFQFQNLLGTVYRKGNVVFTPDGRTLISPVGTRVTLFDLARSATHTLPLETRRPIEVVAVSPDGQLLLLVDDASGCTLVSLPRRVVLAVVALTHTGRVHAAQFSPDSQFFALAHGARVAVWRAPSAVTKQFAPFALKRRFGGLYDDVLALDWSPDSRFFLAASRDATVRLFALNALPDFVPPTLAAHRAPVIAAFFTADAKAIYSVSKDGTLVHWVYLEVEDDESSSSSSSSSSSFDISSSSEDSSSSSADVSAEASKKMARRVRLLRQSTHMVDGELQLLRKHFFGQGQVAVASYHKEAKLLLAGFQSGVFGLYAMPEFTCIHTLSASRNALTSVCLNRDGNWLAAASGALGQLLVWEWQSESYVLKQQGHTNAVKSVAYAPDGGLIVTGGDDGKVKLWNTVSGFCFVTFSDHKAPVPQVVFSSKGHVALSCSLDGTVRAFDLVRYRNFRVMTAPTVAPAQFSCLAVDPAGEIVVAGAVDSFDIYVWSVQTGRLLDTLAGHTGPVSALSFSAFDAQLASVSWDRSVRVWDIFQRKPSRETFAHTTDVLAVAYRPDGRQLCAATLDGQLLFYEPHRGEMLFSIDGRPDVAGGRSRDERRTAAESTIGQCFDTISYAPDGATLLAAGRSKFICLYAVEQKLLLRKFQFTFNVELDGLIDKLDSRLVDPLTGKQRVLVRTEVESDDDHALAGDEFTNDQRTAHEQLPGVKSGQFGGRKQALQRHVAVTAIQFSPTGESFAAASVDGLLLYSLDDNNTFDPIALDVRITPAAVHAALQRGALLEAMIVALRLNDEAVLDTAFYAVPRDRVALVVNNIPSTYVARLVRFISSRFQLHAQHVEFHLLWLSPLLTTHGDFIKKHPDTHAAALRAVKKALAQQFSSLADLADSNRHTMRFLLSLSKRQPLPTQSDEPAASGADVDEHVNLADEELPQVDDGDDDAGDWVVPTALSPSAAKSNLRNLEKRMNEAAAFFGGSKQQAEVDDDDGGAAVATSSAGDKKRAKKPAAASKKRKGGGK